MLMFSLLNVVLPLYLDDKWGLGAMAVGLFIAINSFTFAVCQVRGGLLTPVTLFRFMKHLLL